MSGTPSHHSPIDPEKLLLAEFVDDDLWQTFEHGPSDLASQVAGVALDEMFGTRGKAPAYLIDGEGVSRVASELAERQGINDPSMVGVEAARQFEAIASLKLAS